MEIIKEVQKWQDDIKRKERIMFKQDDCIGVEVGNYNVTIWKPDNMYKGNEVGLFQLDKFDDNDEPIGSKFYYYKLPIDVPTVFSRLDRIWTQRVGSWIN